MKSKILVALLLFLTAFLVTIFFMWQGHLGFSLWDEGYLWYGAQRVLQGEIPIRDFQSYEPGRYYWAATFMYLFGDNGIMALRVSVAIFQAIGVFVGLFLICSSAKRQNIFYIFLSAIILMLWMYPRHKFYDISISILLIGSLYFLIHNPTARRYFFSGLVVGLAAVFGRNHGLYGIIGSLTTMVWLSIKREPSHTLGSARGFFLWSAGVITGFMPVIIMTLVIPGFGTAFLESIFSNLSTIPRPIPWPWLVNFSSFTVGEAIRGVLVGLFFISIIAFGVFSAIWVFYKKLRGKHVPPQLAAAAFMVLPYAHHACWRADVSHLAQGIFPLLIGCLIIFSAQPSARKWIFLIVLCMSSIWTILPHHPGWQCCKSSKCVTVKISQSNLLVSPETARDIKLLRRLVNQYAPDGQSFIAAPFWPGAYALLQRKSPLWEIYSTHPRPQAFEKAEIERIKRNKPTFAIILAHPLSGRDELRYKNTHPLTNKFIQDNFERIPYARKPEYQIYKAKWISG